MHNAHTEPTPLPLDHLTVGADRASVRAARITALHEDWIWGGPATPLIIALRVGGDDVEAARILRVALADPSTPDRALVATLLS